MYPTNDRLNIQRERKVRQRLVHRSLRGLRRHVGSLRRLLTLATVVALIALGVALYFALRPAPAPEAVVLGQGRAGVKALAAVEREAPEEPPSGPADTGDRGSD